MARHTGSCATHPEKRSKHWSGEVEPILATVRDRCQRGTRAVLDWDNEFQTYLGVIVGLLVAIAGAVALLDGGPWWQPIAGWVLLVATLTVVALLFRWILQPVDPTSRARLDEFNESMGWRNIFKK